MNDLVLTNMDLVLQDSVVRGSLRIKGGVITDVMERSGAVTGGVDGEGDLLLPGLIEIHTDALEWHLRPRPQSPWPAAAAVAGHDAMLAASGITTVLDSLCLGDLGGDGFRADTLVSALAAITSAQMNGHLRIDHQLHFRCEVADPRTPGLFDELVDNPLLRLVSLMDHTPGGRQYTDIDGYRRTISADGHTEGEVSERIARLQDRQAEYAMPNWARIAKLTVERGLPLASHDDATAADIALAVKSGVNIAEFPTTELAAVAAKAVGLSTAAGAPNIIRGGSHSGNVSATHLAGTGVLDIITSDYVPYSLLHAPFVLAAAGVVALPAAVALVTTRPACAVGLVDRGRLAVGLRADLVQVRVVDGVPMVRAVYSNGARVG